ncbi:hypothetical protein M427DRAFT_143696 [Gonapodya prolifera JEL478]|uniref:Uncharacterized protein n=1 Tax=Gonapodya prolifera (strain JEL478) TaxID=1344416 RepID=A0A139APD7_GONPJ|nr:hypothetical protein M427DRAFT_143696 [Gonapodya prolifera JEL478]|eukprot:KXS18617.1 hypothetical protein M427DRAFT_143696 [Gonapodya prolifera JEL478]
MVAISQPSGASSLAPHALEFLRTIASSSLTIAVISIGLLASTELSGYNGKDLESLLRDRETCTCECWDGRYRGSIGDSKRWKPVYFNYDVRTVVLFGLFLLFASLLQTAVSRIAGLVLVEITLLVDFITGAPHIPGAYTSRTCAPTTTSSPSLKPKPSAPPSLTTLLDSVGFLPFPPARMRWWVLPGHVLSIYATFYGVWCILNYINDRDNRMIRSQVFFVLTELVPVSVYHAVLPRPASCTPPCDSYTTLEDARTAPPPSSLSSPQPATPHHSPMPRVPVRMGLAVLTISLLHLSLAFPERILWGMLGLEKESRRGLNVRDALLSGGDVYGLAFGVWVVCTSRSGFRAVAVRRWMEWAALFVVLYAFYNAKSVQRRSVKSLPGKWTSGRVRGWVEADGWKCQCSSCGFRYRRVDKGQPTPPGIDILWMKKQINFLRDLEPKKSTLSTISLGHELGVFCGHSNHVTPLPDTERRLVVAKVCIFAHPDLLARGSVAGIGDGGEETTWKARDPATGLGRKASSVHPRSELETSHRQLAPISHTSPPSTLSSHGTTLPRILSLLTSSRSGVLDRTEDILVVGHRIVHGGVDFVEPAVLGEQEIEPHYIQKPLRPLHNAVSLCLIHAARSHIPHAKHVGVFDTAFHVESMKEEAWVYVRLPRHVIPPLHAPNRPLGRSRRACGGATSEIRSVVFCDGRVEICGHQYKRCPASGLIMGTRAGDLDPEAIVHLLGTATTTTVRVPGSDQDVTMAEDMLNHKSGLVALCGAADMKLIERCAQEPHDVRTLIRPLGGIDAVVFTGGVGEVSAVGAAVKVFVEAADEEGEIARECKKLVLGA